MQRSKRPLHVQNVSFHDTFFQLSHRSIQKNVSLHWHSFFELEFLIKGEAYQTINGNTYHYLPGSCCLLSPSDYHSIEIVTPIEILNLSFNESILSQEQLEKVVIDKSLLFHQLQQPERDTIESLFRLCIKEHDLSPQDSTCLKMMINCLLTKFMSSVGTHSAQPFSPTSASSMQAAILFLHTHFHESPSLSQVAKIAHYNSSYFSTIFREEFGMSYTEYLSRIKIGYAKKLLLSTDLSIEKICQQSGFASPSTFLQTFKKLVGTAPTNFRNSNW